MRDLTGTEGAPLPGSATADARERQFRILVEGITDYAIFMLSPSGVVQNWNAGAERIKGYKAEQIIGQHFSCFYMEEARNAGEPARALAIAAREGKFETEGWRVRGDGRRFWANVVIDPLRSDTGTLLGYAKITRDITERRDALLATRQAHERLLHAQKLEALGQLAGGVAHDINNVLQAVLGGASLMRRRPADAGRVERLSGLIEDAAQRGASVTRRLLAFARRDELSLASVDLHGLLGSCREDLARALGPSARIVIADATGLAPVLTDPGKLQVVLADLAANARDAMPGGGTLTLTASAETVAPHGPAASGPSPGAYVRLSVADTGAGMDERTLGRASEPFFTTKPQGKGTGLGLAMARGFVEQSGGALAIRSEAGRGTTVILWLPVATADGPRAEPAASSWAAPGTAGRCRRPRVLLVDDEAQVREVLAAQLADAGHDVATADDAAAALRLLEAGDRVDLLISDLAMPGMDGMTLIHAARRRRPGLPALLLTGDVGPASAPDGGVGEAFSLLRKPVTGAQLAERAAALLSGRVA